MPVECIFLSQVRHYDSFPDFTPSSDASWCLTDSQHWEIQVKTWVFTLKWWENLNFKIKLIFKLDHFHKTSWERLCFDLLKNCLCFESTLLVSWFQLEEYVGVTSEKMFSNNVLNFLLSQPDLSCSVTILSLVYLLSLSLFLYPG